MLQLWDSAWAKVDLSEATPAMLQSYRQVREQLQKAANQSLLDAAEGAGLSPKTLGVAIKVPPSEGKTSES